MTSKLLLEAGASYMTGGWPYAFPGDGDFRVGPNDISTREASTGLQYNSKAAYNAITEQNRFAQRFSVTLTR